MMKSPSTFTGLLIAGAMCFFLTAGVNGQQLDLSSSSRRTTKQDTPNAVESGSPALDDNDSSPRDDMPSEDTQQTTNAQSNFDQSDADETDAYKSALDDIAADELSDNGNKPDAKESNDNTLDGEFASTGWPQRSIQEIRIELAQQERTPADRSASLLSFGRNESLPTSPKLFAWAAPNIQYQPLYFEDVALERYGQTAPRHQQAVKSGIHFFKSLALLPHQMLHDHPYDCDSPLGFCRPGTCVPRTVQRQYFGSVFAK